MPGYPRSVVPNMTGMIESFQEGFDQAWKECTALGKTEEAYVKTVSQYIGDLVQENPIQIEPFTMLSGKEIMAAVQLSADGHSVVLRNADKHLKIDGNTSDALVDGVLCDFKKVTSPKIRKLVKEITGKLARQGPGFLVDISESRISTEAAEARIASLLDDPSIKNVYLINNGVMEYLKK